MKMFKEYIIRDLTLKNRIVMAPMCMYKSDETGLVNEFHKIHYTTRAVGGVGLIIVEATAISKSGRISNRDLGLWSDEQVKPLKDLVDSIHHNGSKACIQIGHAGRKSQSKDIDIVAPSPVAYNEDARVPRELSREDIENLIQDFTNSAIRADQAGFDMIEIHGAHGYLIHQFLSPLSNERIDAYGGSTENRTRVLREILASIRKYLPIGKPLSIRISADDYIKGGINIEEMFKILDIIKPFVDIIHISSGGLLSTSLEIYPGYQVKYSEKIKFHLDMPTISVGLINNSTQIEGILGANQSDLIALGRKLLREPYFVLNTAYENNIDLEYPEFYKRAFK